MNKSKRINLFSKSGGKSLSALMAEKTVFYATVIGIVLFIVFIGLSGLNVYQKSQIQGLLNEKEEMLTYLVENKSNETETTYFLLKKEQLKKYLKDDAEFLPYYNILNDSISSASNEAVVQSMTIDKAKKTAFIINFAEYDAMYKYIKQIESEKFLKNFDNLTLTTFSLNQTGVGGQKGYQLNFEGKFKEVTEKPL